MSENESKELTQYLDKYIQHLKVIKGRTQATLKAYHNELHFLLRLLPNKPINEININDIEDVLLQFQSNSKKTLTRKIMSLRSFFKYLFDREIIIKNPMLKIETPKPDKRIIKVPDKEDFIRVLDYFEDHYLPKIELLKEKMKKSKSINKRKYFKELIRITEFKKDYKTLLFRFLYLSMARITEVIHLKIKDIDFKMKEIRVFGKGNKDRIIPIEDAKTYQLIHEAIDHFHLSSEDYLFLNKYQQAYGSASAIEKKVKYIRKKLNLSYHLSPHMFRKAGATHLRREGNDLAVLQDLLGHSSPETTRIYTQVSNEDIRNAIKKTPLLTSK